MFHVHSGATLNLQAVAVINDAYGVPTHGAAWNDHSRGTGWAGQYDLDEHAQLKV